MATAATPTTTVEMAYEADPAAAEVPDALAPELVLVALSLAVEVCPP